MKKIVLSLAAAAFVFGAGTTLQTTQADAHFWSKDSKEYQAWKAKHDADHARFRAWWANFWVKR